MKIHRIIVVALLSLMPLATLMATPRVRLMKPPPGRWGIEDLWKATVISDTACDAWFEGYVFEATKGQVFHATTKPFPLARGTRVYGYRDVKIDRTQTAPGYEVFVTRSGQLPAGSYRFKLLLQPFGVDDSFGFDVKPMSPPRLVSPRDGDAISGKYPLFVWTRPGNNTGGVTYNLTVVEIQPGQTEEEALRANRPWFQKSGITATQLRYPTGARGLEKDKRYAWQVTAVGKGIQPLVSDRRGFRRALFTPPMKFIDPLKVSREVDRHGNYFVVRLTLTNTGATDLTNIVVSDSHRYFQCLNDVSKMKVAPPGGEVRPGWTTVPVSAASSVRSAGGGFYSTIAIDLGDWVLPPGLSMSVYYSVFPLLTFSLQGPGHTIGAGLKVTYKVGGSDGVRKFDSKAVYPVPGLADAWKAANYMVLTSPARIQGSPSAVNGLLVKLAELAKSRNGALCYLTSASLTATSARTIVNAFGTMLKNNLQNGYLLIVGEDDVIPTWSKPEVASLKIPAIHLSDYDYADPNDDLLPDRRVGRMLGRHATELRAAVQNALDYKKDGIGWQGGHPVAIFVSGPEPGKWLFVKDMSEGRGNMVGRWGNSAVELHTDFITTRYRIIRHALYALSKSGGLACGSEADTLAGYSYAQLAAWLLSLKMVNMWVTKLDLLYPPQSGDTHFKDANGVSRRMPAAFGASGFVAAVSLAEETMLAARNGVWYGAYLFYSPDDAHGPPAMIFHTFDIATAAKDVIVWVGHSGPDGWGDVVGGGTVQNLHIGPRPVVIAFGCHCGNYDDTDAISRAFLTRFASVYIGATENMYPFGDHMLADEWWSAWGPGMTIGQGLQRLKLWNMQAAPGQSGKWLKAPWMTYFVRIMNLYGDPKVGGL